jgi:hypothetical protein
MHERDKKYEGKRLYRKFIHELEDSMNYEFERM